MNVAVTRTLEAILLPPGGPLLLAFVGLALWRARPVMARRLVVMGLVVAWGASLPVVGYGLLHALESYPALDAARARAAEAGAIVVLGAGRRSAAPEYGGSDTASRFGLERLRYAAQLHRVTALPVVFTGGSPRGDNAAEASFMAPILEQEFGVAHVVREEAGRTTAENAVETARLLHELGVRRVLLVTHAWHMPRAMESFRRAGLDAVAAPTGFADSVPFPRNLLPDGHDGLLQTQLALHEWIGRAVYAVRDDTLSR